MTLSSLRPVLAVGLAAAILIYVGCARTSETANPAPGAIADAPADPTTTTIPPTRIATSAAPPVASQDPLAEFAAWSPAPPAAVLVVSGEQDGYLKPCGCTGGQLGGVGRRYDLIAQLRAKGWPVAAVDLGNLIHDPAGSRGGPQQEKIKFDVALKSLAAMDYAAVAVGSEDLKLGVMETLGTLLNVKKPLFLAANLTPTAGFEEVIRPSTLIAAGPVRVGVTAVIEPAAFEALADPDKASLLAIRPPADVLPGVLAELEKDSAVQVLMVQGTPAEAKRLAGLFPGFDLVVATAEYEDPDARPEILNDGRTTLINVGRKGKYAGVVGLFPGRSPAVEFHLQPLKGEILHDAEPMRALVDDEFVGILKSVGVVANYPRSANTAYPTGATYAGAESCQSCHPKTFAKWSSTKHAHAYDALTAPKRNREADAECVSCHVTGFGYTTGFVSAEKTSYLKGNQCENCHGPASLHNAEPDNLAYRQAMHRPAEVWDKGGYCTSCHNADNDPHFEFATYYPQIFHKGLDAYDDPQVHQGKVSKVASARNP